MGGLMSVTGEPGGPPLRAGLAVADMSAGLYCALGILVALLEREVSGRGQWVQSSLLHSMIAMLDFQAARYLNDGDIPVAVGNDHPTSSPMGLYRASDGHFNLGASGQGNWRRLCELMGHPEWLADPDFATEALRVRHRQRLNEKLDPVFAQRTVAQWVDALNGAGVPAGPVYTVPQVFEDEQVRHLGVTKTLPTGFGKDRTFITQPVVLSRTPADVVAPAPGWGEHTEEVLRDLGYDDQAIADLKQRQVV
jgi:crotonobetainyl-CoA:carnitine CoA-transferase CaiB-like acyl-CoA transferase